MNKDNRNEGGGERPKLRLEEDAQGKRAMLGGYQMPDGLIPSLEASPSDLPAREAIERALQFYATEWRGNAEGDPSTPGLLRTWMEPTDRLFEDEGAKAREALTALQPLSQGNGEAVAWQHRFSKNEDGVWSEWEHSARHLVKEYQSYAERMPKRYEVRPLYAAPPSQPEGVRSKQYGPTEWPGDVLREIYPSPGSPADLANKPEGVREALERVRENCAAWCDTNGFPVAGECLRKLALPQFPTPSRGLVEAAEWHDRMADAIPACDPYEKVAWHRDCAKVLRTLSAKGGAG